MRRLAALLVVLAFAAAAVPLAAQSLTGTVSGTVTDSQGAVLPGATVTLVGKTGTRTAVTDASGEYRFVALDPGSYDVQVALSGFNGKKKENISVSIATSSAPFAAVYSCAPGFGARPSERTRRWPWRSKTGCSPRSAQV